MRLRVAADELYEAAFGGVAVVKLTFTVYQADRVYRVCDRFAIGRSLVLLVSCYVEKGRCKSAGLRPLRCIDRSLRSSAAATGDSMVVALGNCVAADELCEAAFGGAAVV